MPDRKYLVLSTMLAAVSFGQVVEFDQQEASYEYALKLNPHYVASRDLEKLMMTDSVTAFHEKYVDIARNPGPDPLVNQELKELDPEVSLQAAKMRLFEMQEHLGEKVDKNLLAAKQDAQTRKGLASWAFFLSAVAMASFIPGNSTKEELPDRWKGIAMEW